MGIVIDARGKRAHSSAEKNVRVARMHGVTMQKMAIKRRCYVTTKECQQPRRRHAKWFCTVITGCHNVAKVPQTPAKRVTTGEYSTGSYTYKSIAVGRSEGPAR